MTIVKPESFNGIKDRKLRAYNRAVTLYNLVEDEGEVPSIQYFSQFDEQGKNDVITFLRWARETAGEHPGPNFMDSLTKDMVLENYLPIDYSDQIKEDVYVN